MRFEGKLVKPDGVKNKFWHVEVAILGIYTQGKTKKDAYDMIKDAIELAIDQPGFHVRVYPGDEDTFTVEANDRRAFVAFMLKQQRTSHGLTLKQVAKRLKIESVNAYARYEQGKAVPSHLKLDDLLQAIDPKRAPVLKFA